MRASSRACSLAAVSTGAAAPKGLGLLDAVLEADAGGLVTSFDVEEERAASWSFLRSTGAAGAAAAPEELSERAAREERSD